MGNERRILASAESDCDGMYLGKYLINIFWITSSTNLTRASLEFKLIGEANVGS